MKALILPLLLALCACKSATTTERAHDSAALRNEVLDTDRAFAALADKSGIEAAFAAYLAPDAVHMVAGADFEFGRDAVIAGFSGGPADAVLSWTPRGAEVSADGELGYTYGAWTYKWTGEDGKKVASSGKYVTIWRRQRDGSFKAVFDGGTSDGPPAAAGA